MQVTFESIISVPLSLPAGVRRLRGPAFGVAVVAFATGLAACQGSSDVYGDDCLDPVTTPRSIDSFDEPLAGMDRTPAEELALHGQAHAIEVVGQADPQLRWDARVIVVPRSDTGTLYSYGASCSERDRFTVPARFEFSRAGTDETFLTVDGSLVIGADTLEESLQGWYDPPMGVSGEFVQAFMPDPDLDPMHGFFGVNVHTMPEYSFCAELKLRRLGPADELDAYGPSVVLRNAAAASGGCEGSTPP